MSHGAAGCEFDGNESTIGYIQKKEEEICRSVLEATAVSTKIKSTRAQRTMEKWLNLWTPFGINAVGVTTN